MMALESSTPQTRRALLAAALGGLAGFVASAIGQPAPAAAAAGDPLRLGRSATTNNAGTANTSMKTNSTGTAFQVTQNGSGSALKGTATGGGGTGLIGQNNGSASSGAGVKGNGVHNHGVVGTTSNVDRYGIRGENTAATGDGVGGFAGAGGSGVIGFSGTGNGLAGIASGSGHGVLAVSATGYAGRFEGPLQGTSFMEFAEMTAPGGVPGQARLFARDNAGKTELCVIFGTGGLLVIAAEP